MPRTGRKGLGGRKKAPSRPPLEEYESLEYHKKLICYNYFQFIVTNGVEGWDPSDAGSVYHQRSSNYLLSLGSDSWFRHLAKQMVTLAQKFASLNQSPPNPTPPPAFSSSTLEKNRRLFPASPLPIIRAATIQDNKEEQDYRPPERNRIMQHIRSPSSSAVGTRTPTKRFDHHGQDDQNDGEEASHLSVPTSFGMWKRFNYTTRSTTTRMLIRLILHNGVCANDIQFEWITPRKLKLMVAWPEWFQYAEQMAAFTTDEDGNVLFPPDHPLTMDTSERNHQLESEDKRIWDEGYVIFEQDMKTDDDPTIELLDVRIPSKDQMINVLQIFIE
jgi:hypothetical protein